MTLRDSNTEYGIISRLNHWIGALLVLTLAGIGLYFSELPRGPEAQFWKGLHVAFGTVAIPILLLRVFWRAASSSPRALPQAPALQLLAKATQFLMLAGILILVVTGPLSIWAIGRPFGISGVLQIPSPFPLFRSWHVPLEEIHGYAAYTVMGLIGLHLAGVLKHQFIDRDGLLARMTGRAGN